MNAIGADIDNGKPRAISVVGDERGNHGAGDLGGMRIAMAVRVPPLQFRTAADRDNVLSRQVTCTVRLSTNGQECDAATGREKTFRAMDDKPLPKAAGASEGNGAGVAILSRPLRSLCRAKPKNKSEESSSAFLRPPRAFKHKRHTRFETKTAGAEVDEIEKLRK